MREKHSLLLECQKIRFKAARNRFKHMVMQGDHVANKPQTVSLLNELASMDSLISDSAWKSWFGSDYSLPQPGKVSSLDQYIKQIIKGGKAKQIETICPEFRDGYFSELVYGGLMSQLLAPTEASQPIHTLMRRALEYQPVSPLHLYFDAVDAAGWEQDFGAIPWSVVAAIAADRILQLLDDRWSPRSGEVYAGFSSNFSLEWEKADEVRREEIRLSEAKMKPNLFESRMKCGASPDWKLLGISPDIPHKHVYKLLFALAADPDFLVEDRLSAWSLDLATSALAMHAMAWPDRYKTMVRGVPPELQYWVAFHQVFFNPDAMEIDYRSIASVMESWPADWSQGSVAVLLNARDAYVNLLGDLGLNPSHACAGLLNVREKRPLIFN